MGLLINWYVVNCKNVTNVLCIHVGNKAFVRPIVAENMLIIQTKNWRFSIELAKTLQYFLSYELCNFF